MGDLEELARIIQQIAASTPVETVTTLSRLIREVNRDDWIYAVGKISASVSNPALRRLLDSLMDVWQSKATDIDGNAIALALLAAEASEVAQRGSQTVDLVWTGPESRIIPLRRTDQALLQIITGATARLLVVSFAVYRVEAIARAMVQAANRGVTVSVCIESPDASEGKIAYDTVRALGEGIHERARFYAWPLDRRPKSPDGKHGSLHTKVAAADGKTLLVSSTNLTEYAMNLNMELGVLIQGGELPGQVEKHFEQLIAQRTLVPIDV